MRCTKLSCPAALPMWSIGAWTRWARWRARSLSRTSFGRPPLGGLPVPTRNRPNDEWPPRPSFRSGPVGPPKRRVGTGATSDSGADGARRTSVQPDKRSRLCCGYARTASACAIRRPRRPRTAHRSPPAAHRRAPIRPKLSRDRALSGLQLLAQPERVSAGRPFATARHSDSPVFRELDPTEVARSTREPPGPSSDRAAPQAWSPERASLQTACCW